MKCNNSLSPNQMFENFQLKIFCFMTEKKILCTEEENFQFISQKMIYHSNYANKNGILIKSLKT